jgi:hypothetical protein
MASAIKSIQLVHFPQRIPALDKPTQCPPSGFNALRFLVAGLFLGFAGAYIVHARLTIRSNRSRRGVRTLITLQKPVQAELVAG